MDKNGCFWVSFQDRWFLNLVACRIKCICSIFIFKLSEKIRKNQETLINIQRETGEKYQESQKLAGKI